MATALTARERAHLKARAHALEPVVQSGSSGVTDRLVAEVDRALTAHELIKVKIGATDRDERVAIGDEICARTGATAVQHLDAVCRETPFHDGFIRQTGLRMHARLESTSST